MTSITYSRSDQRRYDELRQITIAPGIAPNATASVLISFGRTQLICAATMDHALPKWMIHQNVGGGWITAEYSMLPYSTLSRKTRDSTRGKIDGRSIEIQRLIGRSIRAVANLKSLSGYTLWLDCDVLQADGGTRTAAISGAYVAAKLATQQLLEDGKIKEDPFLDSVSGVSVGLVEGSTLLDLNYAEDKRASVDFNVVMTGSGRFVELQGAGEEATFSQKGLDSLIELAGTGISRITEMQRKVIETP